jgi:hypothetical protein
VRQSRRGCAHTAVVMIIVHGPGKDKSQAGVYLLQSVHDEVHAVNF